ncbi:hypothetical protein K505DRAFT_327432 [Melanomma pulvis-pyrius CBS 109.77]|uniref:Uncharacterized protein n=1 Tax=Melanomma pulvis-pyrius CBS 109.77 TaxID=1314802 RepID=A0A6A6X2T9_9PLEO|nr:hypothetical protein K505DRAFT_327432 [Melanomma pulvis-pyrius CBS 109.77]
MPAPHGQYDRFCPGSKKKSSESRRSNLYLIILVDLLFYKYLAGYAGHCSSTPVFARPVTRLLGQVNGRFNQSTTPTSEP